MTNQIVQITAVRRAIARLHRNRSAVRRLTFGVSVIGSAVASGTGGSG